MANIKNYIENIRSAIFGKEVRGSLADGLDAINKETENTTSRQRHLEDTFDQLIINEGNSNAEIVDARVGENGSSFKKLGDRLDSFDSHLAEKAKEKDLDIERKRIDNIIALPPNEDNAETADIRIAVDGTKYSSAGVSVREQFKEVNRVKVEFSKNLFDINKIKKDHYINQETGQLIAYKGWDTFEFNIPNDGVERYGLYVYENNAWNEYNKCFIGFFNGSIFAGGYSNKKLSEAENRKNVNKIVVSVESNYFKKYTIIGKTDDFNNIVSLSDYKNYNDLKNDNKAFPVIKKENIKFYNPYVFTSWNKNCYFKFDKLSFSLNNSNYEILWSDLIANFPSLVTSTMTSRVRNTLQLKENKSLILDLINLKIDIVDSVRENHVLLLAYKWEEDIVNGLLFNSYQAVISKNTGKMVQEFIPSNILEQIDAKSELLSKSLDDSNLTFAYLSDNHTTGHHIGKETDLTNLAINYVDKQFDLDAIINGGDSVLSYGSPINALTSGMAICDRSKYFMCEGNHDRYIDPIITRKQYYNSVLRPFRNNNNVHLVKDRTYYYVDFEKHKVRMIVLTVYDMPEEKESKFPYNDYYGYNQEQMEWLCNTALKISSDYQVIVVTHSAPVTNIEGIEGNGAGGQNPLVLRKILESFKNGTNIQVTHTSDVAEGFFNVNITTSFQTQGARDIICVLSGHNHLDRNVKINGINYLTIACGYVDSIMYSGTYGNREGLTYSAIAFDVCMLFKDRRIMYFKRYGFGNDREITY